MQPELELALLPTSAPQSILLSFGYRTGSMVVAYETAERPSPGSAASLGEVDEEGFSVVVNSELQTAPPSDAKGRAIRSAVSPTNSQETSSKSSVSEEETLEWIPLTSHGRYRQSEDSHDESIVSKTNPEIRCPIDIRANPCPLRPRKVPTSAMAVPTNTPPKRKVSLIETEESRSKSPKRRRTWADSPVTASVSSQALVLLARPGDMAVLSPLHTFVRQHIEVFMVTEKEINQPAPGRKNRVSLRQVGLRCIHCRDLPPREKVKRAVCYPSTVGRVYNSVSDMKFDHFTACTGLPDHIRQRFSELKEEKGKKTKQEKKALSKSTGSSSTAQYYHDAACQMGMVDGQGGVFFGGAGNQIVDMQSGSTALHVAERRLSDVSATMHSRSQALLSQLDACQKLPGLGNLSSALLFQQHFFQRALGEQYLLSLLSNGAGPDEVPLMPRPAEESKPQLPVPASAAPDEKTGRILGTRLDAQCLSPIHCFVRRNVEFFAADADEIGAPSPGRKSRVQLHQVGIRCIHCARLRVKDRVKRSVCFPLSVGGIYHAVSNMKFDHFSRCKGLPAEERETFIQLRANGTRKLSNTATPVASRGFANSTAQYYHDSAIRMGLMDTEEGIRFQEDGGSRDTKRVAAIDGMSVLMIAAMDPRAAVSFQKDIVCDPASLRE